MAVKVACALGVASLCLAAAGFAEGQTQMTAASVPAAEGPSLDLSLEAAQATLATCAKNGFKVAVAVVDSAAVPKLLLVTDGVAPRAIESAQQKAITAVRIKMDTAQAVEQAKTDKALSDKFAADTTFLFTPGGILLTVGGKILGAIAASGAPPGGNDDTCLKAGIARIKDRLK